MRAVYFYEGRVEVREIDELADEGKRVRVRSTGICGSDLHMLEMKFPGSFIAGHEIAGILDDGTPVAVEPAIPCGECEHCRTGKYNLCSQLIVLGIARNGGMAEEVIVPERCLVYLPVNIDLKDACVIEPLAVAVHGMRLAGIEAGQRVAVIGGGTIGLCAVAVAAANHTEVGLYAKYDHQMSIGRSLGANDIEGLYDLVVECAGTDSGIHQAMDSCRSGGKILMLGTYWVGISFPQLAAMMKEITIINAYMYAESNGVRDFALAADLLSSHPGIAEKLISHRFPLSEARKAFTVAGDRKAGAIKVVLEP